jgi:hypothetical protein
VRGQIILEYWKEEMRIERLGRRRIDLEDESGI